MNPENPVLLSPKPVSRVAKIRVCKPAAAIPLRETITVHHSESSGKPPVDCSLADKIEELVFKVGYSKPRALRVVLQVLTTGDVDIDFREYSQRLRLVSLSDKMTRAQAAEVFDSCLAALNGDIS